jgi:hypothetical protein
MFTLHFIFFKVTVIFHQKKINREKIERDIWVAQQMKDIEEKRYEYLRLM